MKVEAPIVAVTVYPDRARITRRGSVPLERGTHELEVAGLTQLLDPDSVRTSGEGTAPVRLLGVDVRSEYHVETPSIPAAELERRLLEKRDADRALGDEAKLVRGQLQVLEDLSQHAGESLARGIGRGRAGVKDAQSLLGFVGSEHELISARGREIAIARREIAAQTEVIEQELDRISGARPRERHTVAVDVEAVADGEFTLTLEYVTAGGAGWRPLYDLALLTEGADPAIELTYEGQVQQSTGEDWMDVDLALSTARPAVSAELPELDPWTIRLYEPPPTRSRLARKAAPAPPSMAVASAGFTEEDMETEEGAAPEPVAAQALESTVDTSGSAVTFRIPRKIDVPADNTPRKVTVLTLALTPEIDFVTVPKLVPEVYRRAKVVNDSEVLLLPGPMSLFHSGEYVGSASLSRIAPGERFEATLGLEDRITVERKLTLQEVGKQLIGDRRVRRYAYEIAAQNLLSEQVSLVIKDQLPIAGPEDVRVRMEDVQPTPTRQSDQGELCWEMALDSQAKATIRFEFAVTVPRGRVVVGLPQ